MGKLGEPPRFLRPCSGVLCAQHSSQQTGCHPPDLPATFCTGALPLGKTPFGTLHVGECTRLPCWCSHPGGLPSIDMSD